MLPLWIYGPLLYENFWIMLFVNMNTRYFQSNCRELYIILIHYFPEYINN